jgi:hypothetical protein
MSGYCGWGESYCGIGNCQSGCSTWPNKGTNYTGPINEDSTCNDIKGEPLHMAIIRRSKLTSWAGKDADTSLSKDLFVEIEAQFHFGGNVCPRQLLYR